MGADSLEELHRRAAALGVMPRRASPGAPSPVDGPAPERTTRGAVDATGVSDATLAGLAVILAGEAWKRDAACLEHPGIASCYFPERGDNDSLSRAKAVCAGCHVRTDCLDYALDHNITEGIWGGTSGRERRTMRRERQAA